MVHSSVTERHIPNAVMPYSRMHCANCQSKARCVHSLDQDIFSALRVIGVGIKRLNSEAIVLIPDRGVVNVDVAPCQVKAVRVRMRVRVRIGVSVRPATSKPSVLKASRLKTSCESS